MGIFTRKKLNSDEYEILSKKFISMVQDLDALRSSLDVLRTNQNSLRGLVNRKMGGSKEGEEETENSKYDFFLPK